MSQMIRTSHFVNEDIYPLTYKKPKPKETIYEKMVTFTDFHGHFLSKKIVPWVADQGKNLEGFCEMWNEFKCLQEEWGCANGQRAGPAKLQVFLSVCGQESSKPVGFDCSQRCYSQRCKLRNRCESTYRDLWNYKPKRQG